MLLDVWVELRCFGWWVWWLFWTLLFYVVAGYTWYCWFLFVGVCDGLRCGVLVDLCGNVAYVDVAVRNLDVLLVFLCFGGCDCGWVV